jgi:ATP-binding cassette subfamily F protein uup
VLVMTDIKYSPPGFAEPLIRDFTHTFTPGERLGIVGRNGTGKTTLLNLIAGETKPNGGLRDPGDTTAFGYFTQFPPEIPGNMRVINYVKDIADDCKARLAGIENIDTPEVLLEKVGFPRARQYQLVSSLSGGERRRLHLASVLVERPNVLILDEPTNDLDLQTVEVVEEVVRSYKGVLLVVSHDRAFMDGVADKLLVLKGDGLVRVFEGNYSEYLDVLEEEKWQAEVARLAKVEAAKEVERAAAVARVASERRASTPVAASASAAVAGAGPAASAAVRTAPPPPARKMAYYERKEYDKLTTQMDKLNVRKDKLDAKVMALAQSGTDLAALEKASLEMGRVSDEVDALTDRWMELAELAGDL